MKHFRKNDPAPLDFDSLWAIAQRRNAAAARQESTARTGGRDPAPRTTLQRAGEFASRPFTAMNAVIQPSAKVDSVRKFVQGATFGLADEASAALEALPRLMPGGQSFGDAYRAEHRRIGDANRAFSERAPATAAATEITGALANPAGLVAGGARAATRYLAPRAPAAAASRVATALRPAVGQTVKRTAGQLAARGAVEGAVGGAATSETGIGNRLAGAAQGALWGAGLNPVAAGAGRALRSTGTYGLDVLGMRPRQGSGLTRKLGIDSVEDRVDDTIIDTIQQDRGEAPAAMRARLLAERPNTPNDLARPETLTDVSGENMRALLGSVVRARGPLRTRVREQLRERAEGRSNRAVNDLYESTGRARENIFQSADDIAAARRAQGAIDYPEAYSQGNIQSEALRRALDKREFQEAYNAARELADLEDVVLPRLEEATNPDGNGVPVRAFDYLKRGLDEVIRRGDNGRGLSPTRAKLLRDRLETALGEVDEQVPEYATARANQSTGFRLENAIEEGQGARKLTKDQLEARVLPGLNDAERDAYVRGHLAEETRVLGVAGDNADSYKRVVGNDVARDRERLLLGDDAADDYIARLKREQEMGRTEQAALGGSQTAERIGDDAGLDGAAKAIAGGAVSAASGRIVPALAQGAAGVSALNRQRYRGALGEVMEPRLMAGMGGRDELVAMLDGLDAREKLKVLRDLRRISGNRPLTALMVRQLAAEREREGEY